VIELRSVEPVVIDHVGQIGKFAKLADPVRIGVENSAEKMYRRVAEKHIAVGFGGNPRIEKDRGFVIENEKDFLLVESE